METETLRKMIYAPVNLFFDITPLGKIYNIYINEMHVAYGTSMNTASEIVERLSGMIVLLSVIYAIPGGYLMFPVFALVIYLMYRI